MFNDAVIDACSMKNMINSKKNNLYIEITT